MGSRAASAMECPVRQVAALAAGRQGYGGLRAVARLLDPENGAHLHWAYLGTLVAARALACADPAIDWRMV